MKIRFKLAFTSKGLLSIEVNSIEEAAEVAAILVRHRVPAVPYDETGREYSLRPNGKLALASASPTAFDLPGAA